MAHPMAADSVKMPQDLQAGYMHMNRFGSPLPIHGLGTPGRTTMAHIFKIKTLWHINTVWHW